MKVLACFVVALPRHRIQYSFAHQNMHLAIELLTSDARSLSDSVAHDQATTAHNGVQSVHGGYQSIRTFQK